MPEHFDGMNPILAPGGTLRLDAPCAAWFECYNRSRYIEVDHMIMVGEVEHCGLRVRLLWCFMPADLI